MKNLSLALCLIVASTMTKAQIHLLDSLPISRMHSYPVPTDSATISHLGWDTIEWSVFYKRGIIYAMNTFGPDIRALLPMDTVPQLIADKFFSNERYRLSKSSPIIEVEDGYLFSPNSNMVGNLYWYSKDGLNHYMISGAYVNRFISKDGKIFGIQQILGKNRMINRVIEIRKEDNKWVDNEYVELPDYPTAIAINSRNNFVIVTYTSLIEVDNNLKVTFLIENPFWGAYGTLYPNSLIIHDDVAFVGMRDGVFKFDLNSKKQEWLMKN